MKFAAREHDVDAVLGSHHPQAADGNRRPGRRAGSGSPRPSRSAFGAERTT